MSHYRILINEDIVPEQYHTAKVFLCADQLRKKHPTAVISVEVECPVHGWVDASVMDCEYCYLGEALPAMREEAYA